jgi:hypothetical protein
MKQDQKAYARRYYLEHKEAYKFRRENHRKRHPEYGKQQYAKHRDGKLRKNKEHYLTNIPYKLTALFRSIIKLSCRRQYVDYPIDCLQYLGCSVDQLKTHIESQWRDKMSWENHGKGKGHWQIDHIKPICSFDLSSQDEMRKCFFYKNTRPLWHEDHKTKTSGDRKQCYEALRRRVLKQRDEIAKLKAKILLLSTSITATI